MTWIDKYNSLVEDKNNVILEIPYLSQRNGFDGFRVHNECGETCAWGILTGYGKLGKYETQGTLYREIVPSGDVGTSAWQIQSLLTPRGVKSDFYTQVNVSYIEKWINERRPVIFLGRYNYLYDNTEKPQYYGQFNHWMTAVGYNAEKRVVYVNDPYWDEDKGAYWAVDYDEFEQTVNNVVEVTKGQCLVMEPLPNNVEFPQIIARGTMNWSSINLRSSAKVPSDTDTNNYVMTTYGQQYLELAEVKEISTNEVWGRNIYTNLWCVLTWEGSKAVNWEFVESEDIEEPEDLSCEELQLEYDELKAQYEILEEKYANMHDTLSLIRDTADEALT